MSLIGKFFGGSKDGDKDKAKKESVRLSAASSVPTSCGG